MPKVPIFDAINKENERIIEEEYQSYKEAINTFFKKSKLQNKLPKKTKIFLKAKTLGLIMLCKIYTLTYLRKPTKSKEDQTTLKNDLEHHYINFKSRHDEIMSLLEALFPNVKKQTQTEKDILQLNNQNIESINQNQRAQNNKEREISAEQTSVQQKNKPNNKNKKK
ncbi:hypothetical protein ['Catharanthus roseus' aster yellows phytoplasma]|uniref:Uncharacterized protein n=1 Tax='Catharanthus roseus' aster yellows phytoplasma TaxID=1193712 RepID=A0A4P6MC48_9MOLU|nr:hypothetical protein ['Catharanthus roseus' aster yellows phytoplasma]QBF23813.1 hypothetical protein EXT02_01205 ['Catharanthus roseus' aster yellows phytoplasma]